MAAASMDPTSWLEAKAQALHEKAARGFNACEEQLEMLTTQIIRQPLETILNQAQTSIELKVRELAELQNDNRQLQLQLETFASSLSEIAKSTNETVQCGTDTAPRPQSPPQLSHASRSALTPLTEPQHGENCLGSAW